MGLCDVTDADVRLPPGTAALALQLAASAADAAAALTGQPHAVDRDAVLAHLLMPLVVGTRPPPRPARPAPGGGWVHDDTGDADAALLAALVAEGDDAEGLAARAQACFLPVTPYRAWSWPAASSASDAFPASAPARRLDPAGVRVVDMTAMWSGPLCTLLLAEWGAQVTTVEPAVRPDGLRGAPAQFAVLDRGKRRVDLDLRTTAGRSAFEALVAGADVLVESFSGRVMPNLGYSTGELRSINPRLVTVAIRAFPDSDWVAYGRGVHAASGLGMHAGRPQPAQIAYPDPLTGLAAFASVLHALGAADAPPSTTVTLAGTIAPLLAGGARPLSPGDPTVVARLARATAGATAAPIRRAATEP
ncbi:MAG: CoA transferase [Ilumatobacteraceae bacterium]